MTAFEGTKHLDRDNLRAQQRFQDKLATRSRSWLIKAHLKCFPVGSPFYRTFGPNIPRRVIVHRLCTYYMLLKPHIRKDSPHYGAWYHKQIRTLHGGAVYVQPIPARARGFDPDKLEAYSDKEIAQACVEKGHTFPAGATRDTMVEWLLFGRRPSWTDYVSARAQMSEWIRQNPGGEYEAFKREWKRGTDKVPNKAAFNVRRSQLKAEGVPVLPLRRGRPAQNGEQT